MKPDLQRGSSTSILGLVFSSLGMAGWLTLVAMLLLLPYRDRTGDGLRDLEVDIGNFVLFFVRLGTGLIGLTINGVFSLTGLITSLVARSQHQRDARAQLGLILGAAGLTIGAALVVWRWTAFLSWSS